MRTRILLFLTACIAAIGVEILRVYFIMPFPGSQEDETLHIAYFIHLNLWWLRSLGVLLVLLTGFRLFTVRKPTARIVLAAGAGLYLLVLYLFNFRFLADKMFIQMEMPVYAMGEDNKVEDDDLVLGLTLGGEVAAYPVEIIGYHHQVRDVVGGMPVMITYCTVCRTGRVFSPTVGGEPETFRLVGMDHYNAMFEDSRTRSWWRQVTGEAVAGKLKGAKLQELPSEQMKLSAWLRMHPDSRVLQPDTLYKEKYEGLALYDEGKEFGRLERRDSLSWQDKSWVVGVPMGLAAARAYDWNELLAAGVLNDTLAGEPVLIGVETDSASFHVFRRSAGLATLDFIRVDSVNELQDVQTGSRWTWDGRCVEGTLNGTSLERVQAYQEYWHSWRTFRPNTTTYWSK
jgi:hypothetical protein